MYMDFELFSRHFLATFFLLIGILFTARSLGLYARQGYTHIHYGQRGSPTWWNRILFNVFRAAILGVCVVRAFAPIDPWLGVFPVLYQPAVLTVGIALLLVAFGVAAYVQGYLNVDWRSGIDEHNPAALVTTGPFSRSRNPTFLAIMIGQFGFFLAFPSVFSLVCLAVGVLVLRRQAVAEEMALEQQHGPDYFSYRDTVPRWFRW